MWYPNDERTRISDDYVVAAEAPDVLHMTPFSELRPTPMLGDLRKEDLFHAGE